MFKSDRQIIYTSLKGWVRYIETGEFVGMDKDLILELAKGDRDMQKVLQRIPVLTEDQKRFIKQINSLADKVLTTGNI